MNSKKKVNFIVTDLDDTIWDWLKMWHNSFEPYINRISTQFNVDKELLKADFKKIHQKYGSSESSYVYQELSCLTQEQKDEFANPNASGKGILHEYYSLKKHNLTLYEGVKSTLKEIKEKGTIIIGFTESNAFYTKYRIKHLELDGLIDFIYAPIDIDVPKSVYKHYSEDYWEPQITEIRYLAKEVIKPAPAILEIILRDFKASKDNTIYIGDKLDKDIFMANEAEIDSVYAKYGHAIDTSNYQLLREVTHWTDIEVEREKLYKIQHAHNSIAKYTLENSFKELLNFFEFFEFNTKTDPKNISSIITIWEKTIDVQQHFNDIELRIRNFALTIFTFTIGGIGYLEKEKLAATFTSFNIPYSSLLSIIGVIILSAFFYMDKYWYHKLLLGSVKHGIMIERQYSKFIPEIKLTHSIGNASPHKFLWRWTIHSDQKYYVFYGLLAGTLLILGIIILLVWNCK